LIRSILTTEQTLVGEEILTQEYIESLGTIMGSVLSGKDIIDQVFDYLLRVSETTRNETVSPILLHALQTQFIPELGDKLLSQFLALNTSSGINQYIKHLTWFASIVSPNYLSPLLSVLPRLIQSDACIESASELALTLISSNPVIAHSVIESVPLSFLTLSTPLAKIGNVIANLIVISTCTSNEALKIQILEFIEKFESEFILNENVQVRAQTFQYLLTCNEWRSTTVIQRWISERIRDREKSVRDFFWNFLCTLSANELVDALLLLLPPVTCKRDPLILMIELDMCLAHIIPQLNMAPIDLLSIWYTRSSTTRSTSEYIDQYFESKNFARKLIKLIASVIGSGSSKRCELDKQKTIRMCLQWYSRISPSELSEVYGKESVMALFQKVLNYDTIQILVRLFDPQTGLRRRVALLEEVKIVFRKFPVWKHLVLHACNLFLDRASMHALIQGAASGDKDSIQLLSELPRLCPQDLEEPGLVDWQQVLQCICDNKETCSTFAKFLGSVNRTDHTEVDSTLVTAMFEKCCCEELNFSRHLVTGLLWSNFSACWAVIRSNFEINEKILILIGKFCRRFHPSHVGELIDLLNRRPRPPDPGILLLLDINNPRTVNDAKALLRAVKYNQEVPPLVLVDLVESLIDLSHSKKDWIVRKLSKILYPNSSIDESDIVAFCGGVRLDIIPVWFLVGCAESVTERNPFSWLTKISILSDSSRKIIEYLLSLTVYLGSLMRASDRGNSGVVSFVSSLIRSTSPICKDNVAALMIAASRGLEKCSIGGSQISPREICSIVLVAVEHVHPAVVRMCIDRSYVITIGTALFEVPLATATSNQTIKDPLILKRQRRM
jgi:hypothetical protein